MSSSISPTPTSTAFNNGKGQATAHASLQQANAGIEAGYWHQNLELFCTCFCCSFVVSLIAVRTWVRRTNTKHFKPDDYWIMLAAILTIPYWACEIATNRLGSGMHIEVIPAAWGKMFLPFERGWALYYFITSMIKVSELALVLDILPPTIRGLRIGIYALCSCIMSLGLALSLSWFFQCEPIGSNFSWTVTANKCIIFGPPRYAWVGLGTLFDIIIAAIPIRLLRTMMLKSFDRTLLMYLFSANLLGTAFLLAGIYGIYLTGDPAQFPDGTWNESTYIMFQNLELLAYTIGAFAPVLARFFLGTQGSRSGSLEEYTPIASKGSESSGSLPCFATPGPPTFNNITAGVIAPPQRSLSRPSLPSQQSSYRNYPTPDPFSRPSDQEDYFNFNKPTFDRREKRVDMKPYPPLPNEF